MQLTKFTDYALRTLMHLSYRQGELATIHEIAQGQRVSENHLMKIVHRLAQLGYVTTVRGKGGGLHLARPPDQYNLGEIVRNLEETLYPVECLSPDYTLECQLLGICGLRNILSDAQRLFLERLDRATLKDLLPWRQSPPTISFARPSVRPAEQVASHGRRIPTKSKPHRKSGTPARTTETGRKKRAITK